jgi:protein SCO1/2
VCAETHKVEGLVVEVDRAQGLLVVSHRPIPGYMPAMTMPFRAAKPSQLDGLTAGSQVVFDLEVGKKRSVAKNVRVTGGGRPSSREEEFKIPTPSNLLKLGDPVPDFELVDQDGRAVRLSQFLKNGKGVVIQFVYTRCPLPDVCPRLAASFAYLHRQLGSKVQLLTITVDPSYDRPSVLKEYAQRWRADGDRWRFLTSSTDEAAVQRVGGLFGVVFWPEEGAVTHTSATAIVGADGRLKALLEGSSYRAGQLKDLVEQQLLR